MAVFFPPGMVLEPVLAKRSDMGRGAQRVISRLTVSVCNCTSHWKHSLWNMQQLNSHFSSLRTQASIPDLILQLQRKQISPELQGYCFMQSDTVTAVLSHSWTSPTPFSLQLDIVCLEVEWTCKQCYTAIKLPGKSSFSSFLCSACVSKIACA